MKHRIRYRDKRGNVTTLAAEYSTREQANARIVSIGEAMRTRGAWHVMQMPGLARASFRNGSYVEIWRAPQVAT